MGFLLELLFEFVFQIVLGALFELGLHLIAAPFRKSSEPWCAALGYALFGGMSLFYFLTTWSLQAVGDGLIYLSRQS